MSVLNAIFERGFLGTRSPENERRSEHYVPYLDGVRAASILFVLAAHTLPIGLKDWNLNSIAGRMGMALFFCLSGYLIVSILHRDQRIIPFLAKRVTRIIPALFLYLSFLLIFFDIPMQAFVENMLFISNYTYTGLQKPMSHLWSLCVEMHFYIAISLIVYVFGRRGLLVVFPAALIVTGMRIETGAIAHINTHLRVDEIMVGGWLALASIHYGDRIKARLSNMALSTTLILVLTALTVVSAHNSGGWLVYLRPYFAMLLVGAIIHGNFPALQAILESWLARYIARISYALYIWHPLMIAGWMNTGSTLERYVLKRPVSYVLAFFAAHVSTMYWETFWQGRVRVWLKRAGY